MEKDIRQVKKRCQCYVYFSRCDSLGVHCTSVYVYLRHCDWLGFTVPVSMYTYGTKQLRDMILVSDASDPRSFSMNNVMKC